jgi:hypothetical protein
VSYHRMFLQHMPNRGEELFNTALPWVGIGVVFVFSLLLLVISWRIFNHFKTGFSEEI